MKNPGFLLLTGLFLLSCNRAPEAVNQLMSETGAAVAMADSAKDGVFIHITESYDDPHRVLMPLKMAEIMSHDRDVIVYMDIHAVELLVKGAEDLNFSGFESARTYLKMLMDAEVGIYACPTCLKIAGFEPADLMDGIRVAEKDKFFSFTKGRIITLDY